MLLSVALRLQWKNGPYSAVDGRRLTAVTNTLRALVLGGVHSTVASRANVLATNTDRRCLNSVNRDTHHSTAKHCTMNTFNPRLNITRQSCRKIYYFPKSICISNIREKKTKFALKLASVFHRAVLTNGHVPRVPGFFLNGVVPCTDHCANYIGTLSFPICVTDRKGKVMHGREGELVMGKKKRGKWGAMQL